MAANRSDDKERRRQRLVGSPALGGGGSLSTLASQPSPNPAPSPISATPADPAPERTPEPTPAAPSPNTPQQRSSDSDRPDQGKPITFSFQPTLIKKLRTNWRIWAGAPDRAEKYDGFVSENAYTQALISYAVERTAGNQREAARLEQYLPTNMRGRR